MTTTNELKCPVCREGMKRPKDNNCYCNNPICPICGISMDGLFPNRVIELNKAIQSRIDKAVIAERDRADCKTCSHERGCSSQVSVMTVTGRIPIDISGCSAHELKFALKKKLYQEKKALNIT